MMSEQPASLGPAEVGAILEQLRAEVRARRLARGIAAEGPLERDLGRALDELELHRVVSAHWPLTARTLPGRVVALVNKIVRRALRWYINPIVEQQNAYNDAAARALRLLADAYLDLGEQLAEVRAALEATPGADERPPHAGGPSGAAAGGEQAAGGSRPAAGASESPARGEGVPLQEVVRARAEAEPPARFPDLALAEQLPRVSELQAVSAHWALVGRRPHEQLIALAKRVVRQYLRWLINPIVEQQNAANAALTEALASLHRLDAERRGEIARLRAHRRRAAGHGQ